MFAFLIMQTLAIAQPRGVKIIPMTPDELDFYGKILHADGHPELTVESGVREMSRPYDPIVHKLNCLDQNGRNVTVTFLEDIKNHRGYYKINNSKWKEVKWLNE